MRIEIAVRRLCLLILTTLGLVRAQGADYYVSPQGSDSNPGSSTQPFRTITRAYSQATAGTTIVALPGVYTDYQSGWGLHLNKNGTASSPITLRSQVRGGAVIDGQNVSDRNQAIYLDGSYNIIDGFEIRGGPHGGIAVWGNYNQILNNKIHHNGNPASTSQLGQDGVYSGENTRNNVYQANTIHDNGRTGSNLDHALYLCGDNEVVLNNVLIRNAAYGLHIAGYTTVSNMKVYNNVIAHNGRSGIILWMAVSGVDIKNNIIFQNARFGFDSWDAHGSGVILDRNLVFGNASGNYNFINGASDYTYTLGTTISSAPLFVNSTSAGFDAHLSAGSPAINAALNLSSLFTTDLDGLTRPASGAWDLGACKYGNTDTTAPAVSLTAPSNGMTVSGSSLAVSANASDNGGVAGVQFKLDGVNLGAEDTSAPYSVTLNTTTLANGTHTLSAVARDAAGNQSTASAVSVVVSNVAAPLPVVTLAATDANAAEAGLDTGLFTLTRTGEITSALTVNLTRGGTATSGSDYVPLVTLVTLPIGAASATVLVTPIDDSVVEGSETVALTIAASSNYDIGSSSSATLTISDNDSISSLPTVTVVATDANAGESGPNAGVFTISRTGSTTSALTVNYTIGGTASAGIDYVTLGSSATIPAGSASVAVTLTPVPDTRNESTETVILTVSANASYTEGSPKSATVNIANARRVKKQAGTDITDSDGDGMSNADELIAGTDPNDALSVLQLSSISAVGFDGLKLTWPSVTDKTYRVVYSEAVDDEYWTDLSEDILADGTTAFWTDSNASSSPIRFYSVAVVN